MNEKKALRITTGYKSSQWQLGIAVGYLKAIGKANTLETALEKIKANNSNCLDCNDGTDAEGISKKALTKYRKEK